MKIIVITGPTASGKTKISVEVAKYLNAQIINADSRYLYKEANIATAKVSGEEMDGVIHNMIDTISLNEDYSIFNYQRDARSVLDRLIKENKNVIIVGGSGLYIKALLYDYKLEENNKVNIDFSKYSNDELKVWANKINSNNDIHVNNRQRLERYISKYIENGNKELENNDVFNKKYDFITFYLNVEREALYKRINDRVEDMFKNGLLEEAVNLKEYKHFKDIIGYKELIPYFNNLITLDEAKEDIKKDSRHYAKRQITWFTHQMNDKIIIDVDYNDVNKSIKEIINYIK